MKKIQITSFLLIFLFLSSIAFANINEKIHFLSGMTVEKININPDELSKKFEDKTQIAIGQDIDIDIQDSFWKKVNNKWVWQYRITVPDVKSVAFKINNINLPYGSFINIYDGNKVLLDSYNAEKIQKELNHSDGVLSPFAFGNDIFIEIISVAGNAQVNTSLEINKIFLGIDNPLLSKKKEKENKEFYNVLNNVFSKHYKILLDDNMPENYISSSLSDGIEKNCIISADKNVKHFGSTTQTSVNGKLDVGSCENDYTGDCKKTRLRDYGCFADGHNINVARSSVALIIQNEKNRVSQCSGTLVNNTNNDGKIYILTARHCAGANDVANPDINPPVRVYWQEDTPCGVPRDSFYRNSNSNNNYYKTNITTTGFTTATVVGMVDSPFEEDLTGTISADAWLLVSDNPAPDGANPYWMGLNANAPNVSEGSKDNSFTTAYNVSFPNGLEKKYATTNNVVPDYDQRLAYWGVDFSADENIGSVSGGSSGSGLIDQNDRLRGLLSATSGITNLFNRINFSWNPVLNGNSLYKEQGGRTRGLAFFLSPDNQNNKIVNSRDDLNRNDNLFMSLSPSGGYRFKKDDKIRLSYVVDNATSCNMTSTPENNDWDGKLDFTNGQRGTQIVTLTTDNESLFTLSCENALGTEMQAFSTFNVQDPLSSNENFNYNDLKTLYEDDEKNDNEQENDNDNGDSSIDNSSDSSDSDSSSGGGCTINSSASFDPLLILMFFLSGVILVCKKRKFNLDFL